MPEIFRNLIPDSTLVALVGLTAYLYNRSFGILYGQLPSSRHQQEQPQVQFDFSFFSFELSFTTMNVLWPFTLASLFFIYVLYISYNKNGYVSKAFVDYFDFRLVLSLLVLGCLILHSVVSGFVIYDSIKGQEQQLMSGGAGSSSELSRQAITYTIVLYSIILVSFYLILRAFFTFGSRSTQRE